MPDVPPGLEPIFYSKVVASGGESAWLPYAGKALFENVIPFDEKQGKVSSSFILSGNNLTEIVLFKLGFISVEEDWIRKE